MHMYSYRCDRPGSGQELLPSLWPGMPDLNISTSYPQGNNNEDDLIIYKDRECQVPLSRSVNVRNTKK